MPLSPAQLDNLFTYHAPTEEQKPKYAAITRQYKVFSEDIDGVRGFATGPTHDEINRACREFVEVIDANAPDSADKTAAIRCVRIARNALNEAKVVGWNSGRASFCIDIALNELLKAKWQANAAIALDGKV